MLWHFGSVCFPVTLFFSSIDFRCLLHLHRVHEQCSEPSHLHDFQQRLSSCFSAHLVQVMSVLCLLLSLCLTLYRKGYGESDDGDADTIIWRLLATSFLKIRNSISTCQLHYHSHMRYLTTFFSHSYIYTLGYRAS